MSVTSEGLWPHKWSSSWSGLTGEGVSTSFQYQITNMGSELSLATFCHENGHMICSFDVVMEDGDEMHLLHRIGQSKLKDAGFGVFATQRYSEGATIGVFA